MKTSLLFTAILATSLFAATAQAQSASASGDAQASARGSLQADGSAAKAAADKTAQAAANAQGQAADALQRGASTAAQTSTKAASRLNATGNKLAQRYAEAAGSVDAAADIVGELHSGADGQAAMSYGSIDNTLALASQLVADGDAASLDAGVDMVQDLRADGLGWGQVAQKLGYHLGSVVSAAHSTGTQVGHAVGGTVSSVTSGLTSSNQVGVNARTRQGSVDIGADTATSVKARAERPSLDAQGSGRLNIGVDARPSLPLVRPLLGH